ncbi:hypothetical protein PAXRUDRAFT_406935 [Paxillus rubicundulus Ve08.2h10]|uniref:Uncharacterized protein n=1 Tax=Paxillus rubicundulus Ve08.2h10 TaxID=930991 RepID=A0A0D0D0A6_9AGAM|nr:hypothetical protein PAXRUDRAFT_406935 [Paxillus rubicundulus Ve08.2h10]
MFTNTFVTAVFRSPPEDNCLGLGQTSHTHHASAIHMHFTPGSIPSVLSNEPSQENSGPSNSLSAMLQNKQDSLSALAVRLSIGASDNQGLFKTCDSCGRMSVAHRLRAHIAAGCRMTN